MTYTYIINAVVILITRRQVGTAYARNGNAHNPTKYYLWRAEVDGEFVGEFDTRRIAYEVARNRITRDDVVFFDRVTRSWMSTRQWRDVDAEMRKTLAA